MKCVYKFEFNFTVLALILLWAGGNFAQEKIDQNCFTIVVGKNVSSDGSTIVAHNEDDAGDQLVNLHRVPAAKHKKNEIITFNKEGKIEQVDNTNGYLWMELPGMKVSDSFVNDYGVVISSDGCPSREENPDTNSSSILYWLRRLVAERANLQKMLSILPEA